MYFESLVDHQRYVTLGGFEAERLQHAKQLISREGFFVPLVELDAMGRLELLQHLRVRSLYSQSAGICQFLMTTDKGNYRPAFIAFLHKLYRNKTRPDLLPNQLDLSLQDIDERYRAFLKTSREQWLGFQFSGQSGLALGHAQLRSEDLGPLAECTSLEWLELSGNPIDDQGLTVLGNLSNLQVLFLNSTLVTDDGLDTLVQLSRLHELDLAGTRITDQGIAKFKNHKTMQTLWLQATPLTDACWEDLASLTKLTTVDLRGTKMTPDAIKRLKQALPELDILYR